MVDPITATAAPVDPPIPAWLTAWETDVSSSDVHVCQAAAGPYQKVRLHNFKFLGRTFASFPYVARQGSAKGAVAVANVGTGAGVCQEFKDALVRVQHRTFKKYAIECAKNDTEPSESEFETWCGVGSLGGWQMRGGKHRLGAAVDIDADLNPYVAVRKRPGTEFFHFGGETYQGITAKELRPLREAAWDAYDRAVKFRWGPNESAEMSAYRDDKSEETKAEAYDRIVRVHYALQMYFRIFFVTYQGASIPAGVRELPRDLDSIQDSIRFYWNNVLKPVHPDWQSKLADKAFIGDLRDKAVADHEALRFVMVNGSLAMADNQIAYVASRDPCRGFLSVRKEIVTSFCEESLRWGGIGFGSAESGDMMHFDLGDNTQVATTSDPNPQHLFYTSR